MSSKSVSLLCENLVSRQEAREGQGECRTCSPCLLSMFASHTSLLSAFSSHSTVGLVVGSTVLCHLQTWFYLFLRVALLGM